MSKKWFHPTQEGSLLEFGYSPKKNIETRRKALREAVDKYGAEKVFHKLQGLANVTQTTQVLNSQVYEDDAQYISDNFL